MRHKSIIVILVAGFALAGLLVLVGCSDSNQGTPAKQSESLPSKLWAGCSINLKIIDTAKKQWADEKNKSTNDPPPTWDDLREYIGRGPNNAILPQCPCGGAYTIGRLDQPAKCSLTPEEHTYERADAYNAKQSATNR